LAAPIFLHRDFWQRKEFQSRMQLADLYKSMMYDYPVSKRIDIVADGSIALRLRKDVLATLRDVPPEVFFALEFWKTWLQKLLKKGSVSVHDSFFTSAAGFGLQRITLESEADIHGFASLWSDFSTQDLRKLFLSKIDEVEDDVILSYVQNSSDYTKPLNIQSEFIQHMVRERYQDLLPLYLT
jgi:hypothetical protein